MFGSGIVAPALAAAVVAWGVPPAAVPLSADDDSPESMSEIFEPDPKLGLGSTAGGEPHKAIVRAIVRRHLNEVKWCYEEELSSRPKLAGRIVVQFTIGGTGQVIGSVLRKSTLGNARVEACAVAAVRRWQFPRLRSGIAIVEYPFVLRPALAPKSIVAGTNGAGAVAIETMEPMLYVHRSTDANGIPSNGLIAVVGGGLLLVDTAWTDAQTEAILAWGDGYFRRPWIGAVISHDHNDRAGGIAALERRRIPVAALDLTVDKLSKRGVRGVSTLFLARDRAFKDSRGFEAFYPGPGHASDNIVLRFEGLVYGGCLVKSMAADDLGFTGDADLTAWPAAIRNVSARYSDLTIVPGHGPVDASGQAYQHTLDLLAPPKRAKTAKK